ncbi:MAG: DUF460 domain-containing protein [Candidatus Aenigmarchaeota archaeon]|nr:DUF460 domain-containing protein [Candidatus Aenigmarchaeota archaeon]
MVKRIIVGIDPGITAGIAILSLDGEVLSLESKRNFKKSEIINYIISSGSPTIIATDKSSPPKIIEKINANFDSILYSPKNDLSQKEKFELTREHKLKNTHQRDALAAALSAFLRYSELIEKVDKNLAEKNLFNKKDEVKDMIIKKKINNIKNAIRNASGKSYE